MADAHAYKPLLHAMPNCKVTIRPVALDDAEKAVVERLAALAGSGDPRLRGRELYLIRNLTRGRGVSFFDDFAYYPDFIVWLKREADQHVVFLDPKGLGRFGPKERAKIRLHAEIGAVEEKLRAAEPGLRLRAYVLSTTPPREIGGAERTREEWEGRRRLFPGGPRLPGPGGRPRPRAGAGHRRGGGASGVRRISASTSMATPKGMEATPMAVRAWRAGLAEDLDQELRRAVQRLGDLRELGVDVDVAPHLDDFGDPVEVAVERLFGGRQHVEDGEPRRRPAFGERELPPDLADVADILALARHGPGTNSQSPLRFAVRIFAALGSMAGGNSISELREARAYPAGHPRPPSSPAQPGL